MRTNCSTGTFATISEEECRCGDCLSEKLEGLFGASRFMVISATYRTAREGAREDTLLESIIASGTSYHSAGSERDLADVCQNYCLVMVRLLPYFLFSVF